MASSASTGGTAASSAPSGGAAASSASTGRAAAALSAASGGTEADPFFLLLRFWVIGLGLPLTSGGMGGQSVEWDFSLRWEFRLPMMVDVIDKVPEAQILLQSERLIEADVEDLL